MLVCLAAWTASEVMLVLTCDSETYRCDSGRGRMATSSETWSKCQNVKMSQHVSRLVKNYCSGGMAISSETWSEIIGVKICQNGSKCFKISQNESK